MELNSIRPQSWNTTRKIQSRKTSVLTFEESDIGIDYLCSE